MSTEDRFKEAASLTDHELIRELTQWADVRINAKSHQNEEVTNRARRNNALLREAIRRLRLLTQKVGGS
jgi:hypothetical protein